jgi:CubicO group peptidase (beta-lactamase class C family)
MIPNLLDLRQFLPTSPPAPPRTLRLHAFAAKRLVGGRPVLLAVLAAGLSGGVLSAQSVVDPGGPVLDLRIERSIDGKPWQPVSTTEMRVLRDGRLWLPYLDRQIRFRLQLQPSLHPADLDGLEPAGEMDEGTFLTLHDTSDLETWRPLDGNTLETGPTGLAMPAGGARRFWKLEYHEQIPDPLPAAPLQIEPNPEAVFGSFPIPTVPGNDNPAYFGEFDKLPNPIWFPGEHAFNQYLFEERVHQYFEGDVKGYAVVLANEDGFQSTVSGGWARDPADGNRRMSTMRPGNVGSVAKLFSGVALMQLLEQMGPDVNTALDQAIGPFLPQRWSEGDDFQAAHEAITFRQLLNHTSGLSDDSTSNAPATIQDNPSYYHFTIAPGGNGYRNENYRIMTYLIPRLADPAAIQAVEDQWADADLDTYLDEVMEAHGLAFEDYMKNVFFPQIQDCAPTPDPASDYPEGSTALMYSSINDTAGLEWNQKQITGFARAQGGYWCSARELARFMRKLRYTGDLLSPAATNLLLTGGSALINNGTATHAGFGNETGTDTYYYKPGRQPSNTAPGGTGRGNAMFFPHDWVCVSVINSDSLNTPNGANAASVDALLDAFWDATRGQPATISKEAMTLQTFDQVAAYLRNHHMEVRWLDLYDIAGVPYVNAVFGDAPEAVAGHIGMNAGEYQAFMEEWVEQKGFAIQQVESYLDHGKIRYAAIITEENRPAQRCYHGYGYNDHVATGMQWEQEGFVPVNVSVVSLNGTRRYTALYEQRAVGFHLMGELNAVQYDNAFHSQADLGRQVVSLNAYRHNGEIHYAAIFHTMNTASAGIHHADRDAYRAADAARLNAGREPVIVTGVDSGDQDAPTWARHGFGSIWR